MLIVAAIVAGALFAARRTPGPSRWLLATVVFSVYPLMGLFSQLWFARDGRYGIISFPVFAIAIAVAVDEVIRRQDGASLARRAGVPAAILGVWAVLVIAPNYSDLADRHVANPFADIEAVSARLVEADQQGVQGVLWTVYSVGFVADDRLEFGVVPGELNRLPDRQADFERLAPERYGVIVETPFDDPQQPLFDPSQYERIEFGTLVLYLPLGG
ncbi:MAG: hypothetical protein ACR2O6_03680 [Ilumatobacteraceae bacterium]